MGHFCPPGSGCGSTDPIESGSNPDPDTDPNPQSWFLLTLIGSMRCTSSTIEENAPQPLGHLSCLFTNLKKIYISMHYIRQVY
jgi:hypothetical protein